MRQQNDEQAFQQTPFDNMTWAQRVDFVQRLSYFPSLTVMVFLRRGLGFRVVKPNTLLILALLLFTIGKYFPSTYPPPTPSVKYNPTWDSAAMIIFAGAMLIAGLIHRRRRWNDFRAGNPWHSHHQGESWLLPLFAGSWFGKLFPKPAGPSARHAPAPAPSDKAAVWRAAFLAWLKQFPSFTPYHVRRYVDPLVCMIAGFIIMLFVSPKLGVWLVLSGSMLVIYEQARYDKRLDHEFDIQDAIWDSENHQETHIRFTRKQAPGRGPRRRTAIPTGRASDTEALSRERREGKAAPP